MHATDAEIAQHINALMDELAWFRVHGVKIHLTPIRDGWKLTFTAPENRAAPKNHTSAAQPANLPVQSRAIAVHEGESPKLSLLRSENPAS